jgi:hypothetical protein
VQGAKLSVLVEVLHPDTALTPTAHFMVDRAVAHTLGEQGLALAVAFLDGNLPAPILLDRLQELSDDIREGVAEAVGSEES